MAEEDTTRETIPTLTWEGSPYRVQIIDNLVMLYDLRDHTQMVKEIGFEARQTLHMTQRAVVANRLLQSLFKLKGTNVTAADRLATEVYDRVLRETCDVAQAESAYDVTLVMANSK